MVVVAYIMMTVQHFDCAIKLNYFPYKCGILCIIIDLYIVKDSLLLQILLHVQSTMIIM